MALCYPVGYGICSLILFAAYIVSSQHSQVLGPLLALILLVVLITEQIIKKDYEKISRLFFSIKEFLVQKAGLYFNQLKDRKQRIRLILNLFFAVFFFYLFSHYVYYFLSKNSWNIIGGYDAQFFWNLKAKFLFRDPSQWQQMFDSALGWSHPDYPLFLPGTTAWGWIMAGKEFLIWPAVIDFTLFTSLTLFVLWYLGSYVSWTTGFIGAGYLLVVNMLRFWSTTQYADMPVSLFMTMSAVILVLALTEGSAKLFFLSGLLAGLSAWTKNEGLFFTGWITILLCVGHPTFESISAKINERTLNSFFYWFTHTFHCDYLWKGFFRREWG